MLIKNNNTKIFPRITLSTSRYSTNQSQIKKNQYFFSNKTVAIIYSFLRHVRSRMETYEISMRLRSIVVWK